MRTLYLLCSTLILAAQTLAQTYNVSQVPYNPYPYNVGAGITIGLDDVWSSSINLPFTFNFFGVDYTAIKCGSNGIISFRQAYTGTHAWALGTGSTGDIPGNSNMLNAIGLYHDIDPAVGGDIQYTTFGVAPNRVFVVSWSPIPMYSVACNTLINTHEVVLYETTNIIEIHIENKPVCPSWNSGKAILGIQNDAGTLAHVVSGRNASDAPWVASRESWRFSPGTTLIGNVISGKVFADLNQNCMQEPVEHSLPNQTIVARDLTGGLLAYGRTNHYGNYELVVPASDFDLTQFASSGVRVTCPTSQSHRLSFPSFTGHSQDSVDFGDSLDICTDILVDFTILRTRRCSNTTGFLFLENRGVIADSNVVANIHLHDSISLLSSPYPYTTTSGTNSHSFNIGTLLPGQRVIIMLNLYVGCDSLRTLYCSVAEADGILTECDTTNNIDTLCSQLVGSYDPNIIMLASQDFMREGYVTQDEIEPEDELEYIVVFQNLGTDYAERVSVEVSLDPLVDLQSLDVLSASHQYYWFVDQSKLYVVFDSIFLLEAARDSVLSVGFVKFKVNSLRTMARGEDVVEFADIYFDQNQPVRTNSAVAIYPALTSVDPAPSHSISIIPNPASSLIEVRMSNEQPFDEIRLTNAIGQVCLIQNIGQEVIQHQIAVGKLPSGVYYLTIFNQGGIIDTSPFVKD